MSVWWRWPVANQLKCFTPRKPRQESNENILWGCTDLVTQPSDDIAWKFGRLHLQDSTLKTPDSGLHRYPLLAAVKDCVGGWREAGAGNGEEAEANAGGRKEASARTTRLLWCGQTLALNISRLPPPLHHQGLLYSGILYSDYRRSNQPLPLHHQHHQRLHHQTTPSHSNQLPSLPQVTNHNVQTNSFPPSTTREQSTIPPNSNFFLLKTT